MTRDEVVELLKARWHATGETTKGDEGVDTWWDVLADYPALEVRRRLRELVQGGAEKVSLALLVSPLRKATPEPSRAEARQHCEHGGQEGNGRQMWRCTFCGTEFLAATHPRAIAAFERGYAEARAEQEHR